MLPVDLRDFITIMSIIIFGAVILSGFFTLIAYGLAINRGADAYRPRRRPYVLPGKKEPSERKEPELAAHDS